MRHLPAVPRWALIFVLLMATALVYLPGLGGDFLFDDYPNIVTNSSVHMERLDGESFSRAWRAYQPGPYGRPLATAWFGLDYLIGGKDPFVFKVSGLIVHLVNTLLVFLLVRALLGHRKINWSRPALAAGLIAMLWAVHPLQISSVLYIVQRMETLAATFTFLGVLVYFKARTGPSGERVHWGLIGASAILAAVGMLSKETAALFPLFVFVMELTLLRFRGPEGMSKLLVKAHVSVLLLGGVLFALLVAPTYLAESAYAGRDFTAWERLLSQPRALGLYLVQMLVPNPSLTTFYYDHFEPSRGLLRPWTTLVGVVVLFALAASAFALRHRLPLYSLGIGWFFAAHALTSNVINLELVFEHRNYIALLGVILAAAALVRPLATRVMEPRFAVAVGALVVMGFGGLGAIRSATWGDPFNLAMDLITLAPDSSRAANDMATLYFGMSDGNANSPFFQFAIYEFERSRMLANSSIIPEQGLIVMAATAGVPIEEDWWRSLIEKVETRVHSAETAGTLHGLLGLRVDGLDIGDRPLRTAMEAYMRRSRLPVTTHYRYGLFLLHSSHPEEDVVHHFQRALDDGSVRAGDIEGLALGYAERGYETLGGALLGLRASTLR